MAKAIKGITIEIEGKTSGLVKSLKEADSEIAKTKSNLKAVEKALKLDPTNVDLIKAKQNLLNEEIVETENKLKLEKEAAEKAAQALKDGLISQGDYDAMQAEIVQTEKELEKLKKEASDTNSFRAGAKALGDAMVEAGGKIKTLGDDLKSVGQELNKLSGAVAGVAAGSIAAYKELDDSLDNIARNTGATGAELEAMEETAHSIFTSMPVDMADVSGAVAQVNTRFKATGKELDSISRKFLKFSDVTGVDVVDAVNTASSAMTTWGIETEDVGDYLDLLTAVAQDSGIEVNTLNEALAENALQFQEMGFSVADAARFLGDVDQSGAEVSQVMSGLSKALKNATDEGIPLDQALADLQETMAGNGDETEALTQAYDLFGARSGAAIYKACQDGKVNFESLGETLESTSGRLDSTWASTQDGADQAQIALNNLKDAGAELGGSILESLAPAMTDLSNKLNELSLWWQTLDPDMQNFILGAGAVVIALGPVITTLGSLIGSIGTITTTIGTMTGAAAGGTAAVGGLATGAGAAAAGPIALLIAAIGLFTYAMIDVYNRRDDWKWGFEQLWNGIKEGFENLKNKFTEGIETIKEKFEEWKSKGEDIKKAMGDAWNNIKSGFTDLKNDARTWGKDLIDNFTSGIRSKIDSVKNTVSNVAQTVRDYLGFSEPKEGPLSNFHTYSPDMIDLWNEGIDKNLPSVAISASDMASVVAGGVSPDYSSQLSSINNALSGGSQVVIPVYIGTDKIDTVIAQSSQRMSFIGGGR